MAEERKSTKRSLDEYEHKTSKKPKTGAHRLYRPPKNAALLKLVEFYDPSTKGLDGVGRSLDEILSGSEHNDMAPVLNETTTLCMRRHPGIQRNIRRVLKRMLAFFGFDITWDTKTGEGPDKTEVTIVKSENFEDRTKLWMREKDHNHLRITRIIRSLRVLDMGAEASAFYSTLVTVCSSKGRAAQSSKDYWARAAKLPLHIAPAGTEVDWLEAYAEDSEENSFGAESETPDDSSEKARVEAAESEEGEEDSAGVEGEPSGSSEKVEADELKASK